MADMNGFDAHEVDPKFEYEALPEGRYLAMITASERKPTKNGDGHYLELVWEVVDGSYQGRRLWSRLNLDNPSEKAVTFARAELSAICRAVGVMKPNDSVELHDVPVVLSVKRKKRSDTGDWVNQVAGYAKKEEAGSSPPEATNTAPWKQP